MLDDPITLAALEVCDSLAPMRALALAGAMERGEIPKPVAAHELQARFTLPSLTALRLADVLSVCRAGGGEHVDACMAAAIRAVTARGATEAKQTVELVWTGPDTPGVARRTTYSVALQLLREAREEAIVVGYALTRGAEQIIAEFARARARGVHLSLIGQRLDTMLHIVRAAWPVEQPLPDLYSFEPPEDDLIAALHAKLIVVDRSRMLVTSANLTYHGLRANIEIGVLCQGPVARDAAEVLASLIAHRVLRPLTVI